jgi:hypothetical protein
LFESVWSQNTKDMKQNRKENEKEPEQKKGSHWADLRTGQAQQPSD